MEKEVGSHDGGDGPQIHSVSLFPGNHLTEELEQGLKETHMNTHETEDISVAFG